MNRPISMWFKLYINIQKIKSITLIKKFWIIKLFILICYFLKMVKSAIAEWKIRF